ncbi:MAG: OmpA family protein [Flavobacteriales bacterium]|nr:OmpA family protein [Flavobacteriales bacterium]MDG1781353.1 OmpA family protein [Flavobacteriales bacterium]
MRFLLTIGLVVVVQLSFAQQTTIINHFEGDTTNLKNDQSYVLSTSEQHTVVINYYEIAGETDEERMKLLISDALNFYIDRSILIEDQTIQLNKSPARIKKDLDAIVDDAVDYYHFKEIAAFDGFSKAVSEKVKSLKGKRYSEENDQQDVKGTVINNGGFFQFVETQVNELKQLVNQELGSFTGGNLMVKVSTSEELLNEEQQAKIEEAKAFKTNDPLNPMEIDFSKSTMSLLAAEDEFILPTLEERIPTGDLADRILGMLEQNNEEIASLRGEVAEIKANQAKEDAKQQSAQNQVLQDQINELREMMTMLVQQNLDAPPVAIDGGSQQIPSPAIRPSVRPSNPNSIDGFTIPFYSGGTTINLNAQLQLNELVSLMAYNPSMRIMLTGYADAVGSRDQNLRLSKARAQKVRSYLLDSGIEPHRVLVNFFGEEMASGNQSGDRRVEVVFLPAN